MILNKMGPGVNMIIFEASIFLSSFLLFQVQPMIGKFILPWFGGTPTVWSTAMLFFQIFLTGGYAYAAWLMRRARQSSIHITLLGTTIVFLALLSFFWPSPITPSANIPPDDINFSVFHIFPLLTISVCLAYIVLASN